MNRNKPFPWGLAAVSFLAVAAILISVLPATGLLPAAPTATAADTHTPAPTPTPDPCSPANIQPIALDFNGIASEFDDYSVIAQNTPRQDLSPTISELQRIRRSSDGYVVPSCLATLKELQLAYMNAFIEAIVALFATNQNADATAVNPQTGQIVLFEHALTDQDAALINQNMGLALQYHEQYLDEMARIMGVTRVPTQTLAPQGTTTPEGPLPESTATATP